MSREDCRFRSGCLEDGGSIDQDRKLGEGPHREELGLKVMDIRTGRLACPINSGLQGSMLLQISPCENKKY